jgi:hypothetical protein
VLVAFAAVAVISGRPGGRARVLVLAAALLSLGDVTVLRDPGFQLTFAAALGMAVIAPALREAMDTIAERVTGGTRLPPAGEAIGEAACISVAVTLATLPVTAAVFHEVPVYGVLANTVVNPVIPLLTGMSLLAGLVGALLPALAAPACALAWPLIRAVEGIGRLAATAPHTQVSVPRMSGALALLWFATVIAAAPLARAAWRWTGVSKRTGDPRRHGARRRTRYRLPSVPARPVLAAMCLLLAGGGVAAAVLPRRGGYGDVLWVGDAQPALYVRGQNGARVLVVAGGAPDPLAGALQRAAGAGARIDLVVDLLPPVPGRSEGEQITALAHAVQARGALVPSSGGEEPAEQTANSVALTRVRGAARIALGGGDVMELIADGDRPATLLLILNGATLVVPGDDVADVLENWDEPPRADVLALLRRATVADRDVVTRLGASVTIASGHGLAPAPLEAITGWGNTVNLDAVRDLRLVLRDGRPALSYRDR